MKQKEEGFVPVQYKILKLSSRMIINTPNREHEKKEKGSGEIEFYSIPEIPLIDWLTKSYGDSGLVTIGDNILFQKIREVVSPETTIDENGEDITPNEQQYRAYLKLKEMRKEIKKLKRKANEHPTEGNAVYSKYWMKKRVEKIDACRSPMTDIAEHNILDVCNKDNVYRLGITPEIYDEMERYYKYINSGIIYSLHDLSTVKHSDSDFDSDMVCTFNSEVYINNAWDVYPTTYEKGVDNMTPKKYDITEATESDKQGFGNEVGVYSNMSTSLFAMMPLFPVDEEKAEITVDENGNKVVKHPEYLHHTDLNYPEYDCSVGQLELFKSIKKDRFLIGEEIDSTKTGVKPKLSQEFKIANWKEQKDEIRRSTQKEKEKYAEKLQESNKYIPNYLPYFFINVKSNYKDKYTKYQSRMRDICKMYTFESIDTFVKDVMHGKRKLVTEDEKYFWNYYKDNCPLLLTDCLMMLYHKS